MLIVVLHKCLNIVKHSLAIVCTIIFVNFLQNLCNNELQIEYQLIGLFSRAIDPNCPKALFLLLLAAYDEFLVLSRNKSVVII